MSQDQIREVGKALLPYLRNDLTDAELGMAAHDAVAALNRVAGIDRLRAENADLKEKITALEHVIGRYQIHPRHRTPDPPQETKG